jgi:hypothetical protein
MEYITSSLRYNGDQPSSGSQDTGGSGRKVMQMWNIFSGINSSSSESKCCKFN